MRDYDREKWKKVVGIWHLIEDLRSESGCPWDRKQTPQTLQTYLLEESHEAAAAIRSGNAKEAAEELGDLLFMVLFLVYLYEEMGSFGLEDVSREICDKMIRRHPHVFGDVTVNSTQDVKDNWEKIKAGEKNSKGKPFDGIPESLPALARAYRMLARLEGNEKAAWGNLNSKAEEYAVRSQDLCRQLTQGESVRPELFGEVLLQLVNLARIKGVRSEDCLHERLRQWGAHGAVGVTHE